MQCMVVCQVGLEVDLCPLTALGRGVQEPFLLPPEFVQSPKHLSDLSPVLLMQGDLFEVGQDALIVLSASVRSRPRSMGVALFWLLSSIQSTFALGTCAKALQTCFFFFYQVPKKCFGFRGSVHLSPLQHQLSPFNFIQSRDELSEKRFRINSSVSCGMARGCSRCVSKM